jgi:hypothetical protein
MPILSIYEAICFLHSAQAHEAIDRHIHQTVNEVSSHVDGDFAGQPPTDIRGAETGPQMHGELLEAESCIIVYQRQAYRRQAYVSSDRQPQGLSGEACVIIKMLWCPNRPHLSLH